MAKFAGRKIYCNTVHSSNNGLCRGIDVANIRAVGGVRLAKDLVADANITIAEGNVLPALRHR